jgi:hypothetical protein
MQASATAKEYGIICAILGFGHLATTVVTQLTAVGSLTLTWPRFLAGGVSALFEGLVIMLLLHLTKRSEKHFPLSEL